MGHALTKNEKMLVTMIQRMLTKSGFRTSVTDVEQFIAFLKKTSPWFVEEGSLTVDEWKRVGKEMRKYVQVNGEKTLPPQAFQLWFHLRDLLSDTTPFQGLCRETASDPGESPIYDEVGPEDGDEEELIPLTASAPPVQYSTRKIKKNDDDWGLDDQQAEQEWEDDYRDHSDNPRSLKVIGAAAGQRPMPKPRNHPPLPPVGFQGAMAEARRTGDASFGIFPVTELWDDEGPVWEPLPLKVLKELQSAVKNVGASAPYTLQIVDVVASSWLTPYDWMQTAKATLSPGDYILWRTEYEDKSRESVVQSLKKRGPKPTMAMLMGTEDYATPQSQTKIPRDILQLITTNAVQSWRKIPPQGTKGGALASIKQGTEESYQDFIARLEEAVSRMLPPSEGTSILLKQLAWENANALCQDLIRSIRKTGTLQDYIKACQDASPVVVQGMAYAAAMKGQRFSAYIKQTYGNGRKTAQSPTCFQCGKEGHMQKECRQGNRARPKKGAPGLCPRCKRGKHWRNECKSKFHKDGTPLGKGGSDDEQEETKN
ncbi:endogenous retrovirus group K member 6 Gag polyprotein-like [Onychomys torridus]|uniref:endogenous retrovirus group K member 6 Gag polyprotein-like n=1 Tax=Onychomys torridus TaxID=38674 RepID=UPI00167F54AE|nr:endogenous retrovirus group K member 6 Gag polyprotein-like [Onychomys torridus]